MAGDLSQSGDSRRTPMTYDLAVRRKAEMIANVAFWFDIAGQPRPSDDAIWKAWGEVLRDMRTANSADVARHLWRS